LTKPYDRDSRGIEQVNVQVALATDLAAILVAPTDSVSP
jgi:hypothetical protein